MRTHSSRILALFLALCFLTALLAACKTNPNDPDVTTEPRAEETEAPDNGPSNTDIVRQIYGDKNYDGKEFRILGYGPGDHWNDHVSNGFNEIWFENDSADALSSAVYTRNRRTEDLLNIKIVPNYPENVNERLDVIFTADDDLIDAIAISIYDTYGTHAYLGRLLNFYNMEAIDMTHDWWDQQLISDFSLFGNKLYAMSGDAFVFDDYSVSLFFFNRDMITAYGLENPYDHVRAGTWTFDTMMSMAHVVTNDKNNDGHMDELDTWGSSCFYGAMFHLIYACDITLTVNDYLGTPVLNLLSDEMIDRVSYLFYDVISTGDMMLSGYTDDAIEMLANGDMLFYHTLVSHVGLLRGYDFNFGVLPLPKYEEAQTRYTSAINTSFYTCYSIPRTVRDTDFVGTVLETLSGFSTDTVDSTIYETLLGHDSQLLHDDDSVEMLKYIFDGKLFDWCGFGIGDMHSTLMMQTNASSFSYVSQTEIVYESMEAQLNDWISVFEALD